MRPMNKKEYNNTMKMLMDKASVIAITAYHAGMNAHTDPISLPNKAIHVKEKISESIEPAVKDLADTIVEVFFEYRDGVDLYMKRKMEEDDVG